MNAITATAAAPRITTAGTATVSFLRVLRSEWIKLSTIRSTYLLLGITVLLLVGIWSLASLGFAMDRAAGDPPDPVSLILNPYSIGLTVAVGLAQLSAGVLGVVFVTNEYATGMVRATFAAVPARTPVLLAKAAMLAVVTFAVMTPALFVAFFVNGAILSAPGLDRSLADPEMLRALFGGGLYLAGIAVLGAILGWLLRSAAGAIAAFVGLVILLPILLPLIPLDLVQTISSYLPSVVGQELFRLPGLLDDLTSTKIGLVAGTTAFLGYILVGGAVAAIALKRRDA